MQLLQILTLTRRLRKKNEKYVVWYSTEDMADRVNQGKLFFRQIVIWAKSSCKLSSICILYCMYMLMFLAPAFNSIWVNIIFLTFLIQEPFNAEPPRSALISSYVTPVDLFYKRNHGPIPIVHDLERLHFLM